MNTPKLTALVVHESMFHNTATVAEVVATSLTAEGMSVTCVDVADAPPLEGVEADLLVVGAPTYAFPVEDTKGPLIDGEVERASEWGRELARDVAQRLSVGAADDLGRR